MGLKVIAENRVSCLVGGAPAWPACHQCVNYSIFLSLEEQITKLVLKSNHPWGPRSITSNNLFQIMTLKSAVEQNIH